MKPRFLADRSQFVLPVDLSDKTFDLLSMVSGLLPPPNDVLLFLPV